MAKNKKTEGLNLQPQALEAEEAVLGSMMIDEDAANKAISILGSSHYFYKDSHRKIFEAMISLMNNNDPIDTVSVSDELKKGKNLKSIGGIYKPTNPKLHYYQNELLKFCLPPLHQPNSNPLIQR